MGPRAFWLPAGIAALALAACAHVDARKSLMEADARFAAEVAARGVDAWVETFADDGAMLIANAPLVRGHDKIRELMSDLGDPRKAPPALQIKWRPLGAQASEDGSLGWTWGNAVSSTARGERQSKYLTVWRRQADGSWKVQADQGSPGWADPASPP